MAHPMVDLRIPTTPRGSITRSHVPVAPGQAGILEMSERYLLCMGFFSNRRASGSAEFRKSALCRRIPLRGPLVNPPEKGHSDGTATISPSI